MNRPLKITLVYTAFALCIIACARAQDAPRPIPTAEQYDAQRVASDHQTILSLLRRNAELQAQINKRIAEDDEAAKAKDQEKVKSP